MCPPHSGERSQMYCRQCNCSLVDLSAIQCPECGCAFDAKDRDAYRATPVRDRNKRCFRAVVKTTLVPGCLWIIAIIAAICVESVESLMAALGLAIVIHGALVLWWGCMALFPSMAGKVSGIDKSRRSRVYAVLGAVCNAAICGLSLWMFLAYASSAII